MPEPTLVTQVARQLRHRWKELNFMRAYGAKRPVVTPTVVEISPKYVMVITPNVTRPGAIKGRLFKHDHPIVGQLLGGPHGQHH